MGRESRDQLERREPFDMFTVIVGRGVGIGDLLSLSFVVKPLLGYRSPSAVARRGTDGVTLIGKESRTNVNVETVHETRATPVSIIHK